MTFHGPFRVGLAEAYFTMYMHPEACYCLLSTNAVEVLFNLSRTFFSLIVLIPYKETTGNLPSISCDLHQGKLPVVVASYLGYYFRCDEVAN